MISELYGSKKMQRVRILALKHTKLKLKLEGSFNIITYLYFEQIRNKISVEGNQGTEPHGPCNTISYTKKPETL